MKRIKVLIIDDSALSRSVLSEIIGGDKRIEVVGTAFDPIMALTKIAKLKPDVLTLDLIMPKMDGITFLKKLSKENPIPTVVISGNSPKDSSNAIQALEYGAIEIIEKPNISNQSKLDESQKTIRNAVVAASLSGRLPVRDYNIKRLNGTGESNKRYKASSKLYVMGASTGGPKLLGNMFSRIKSSVNRGFVIAQHMPAGFTKSFAERMNAASDLKIVEAKDRERVENGKAIVIPGGYHGEVKRDEDGYYIKLNIGNKVNRQRPSVDVLFDSAAMVAGREATGILLTGMGDDGAKGLKQLFDTGATTIVQDEASCVVWGMPRAGIELGAAEIEASPREIVQLINTHEA